MATKIPNCCGMFTLAALTERLVVHPTEQTLFKILQGADVVLRRQRPRKKSTCCPRKALPHAAR